MAEQTRPQDQSQDLPSLGGQIVAVVTTLGPPLTIGTALLFYFGWVRTSVEARELGVDDRIFGYSTQDYVIRSISTLFWPIVLAAALGIGGLVAHGWLVAEGSPTRRHYGRILGAVLLPAFVVLPVLGWIIAELWPLWRDIVLPLSLAAGILLTAYGARLRRRLDPRPRGAPSPPERRRALLIRALVTLLVAMVLFWEVGNLAAVVGRGLAYRIATSFDQLTGVVLYSEKDLQIDAPGVTVTRLPGTASAYTYRYEGLRLLERSGGRLFLLPLGWTLDRGTLLVVPDDNRLRVEYTHGL